MTTEAKATTTPNPYITTRQPDHRILYVLLYLATRHRRPWVYPSQSRLLELLRRFHHRAMTRRTLNRHLSGLQATGFLRRIRRHRRGPTGALEMHSTVYVLARQTLKLYGYAVHIARQAVDNSVHWLGGIAVSTLTQSEHRYGITSWPGAPQTGAQRA